MFPLLGWLQYKVLIPWYQKETSSSLTVTNPGIAYVTQEVWAGNLCLQYVIGLSPQIVYGEIVFDL